MRKLKRLRFKAESKINLETCSHHFKDSIIWLYANKNEQPRFVDCGCTHICIMVPFWFFSSSESRQDSTLIARTITSLATHAVCWQSGRQAPTSFCYRLPLVMSSLKSAVLFTRNCYQRRGQKKEKKKITCPEQLISVSCICMSAKILPYTETLRRGPSKLVQGLRALSLECT